MAFFPVNFMLQTPHDEDDHHPPTSVTPILPPCPSQDFLGGGSFLGKRWIPFPGTDGCDHHETTAADDDLSDDGSCGGGEKKRRLSREQVRTLEKNFELGKKLEPERKMQLAKALNLQPRQIAIWFQNRRARWKTKQLERDYEILKKQFESIKADNDALQNHNQKLQAEILALKNREAITESINLNKETEGSCSNRSEDSSELKLDVSRTPAIDSHLDSTHYPISRPHFPPPTVGPTPTATFFGKVDHTSTGTTASPLVAAQLFQRPDLKNNLDQNVKDESFANMFCPIDDPSGFWPWLEQHQQQHFD